MRTKHRVSKREEDGKFELEVRERKFMENREGKQRKKKRKSCMNKWNEKIVGKNRQRSRQKRLSEKQRK